MDKEVHPQNDFLYCNASISPFKWMFDESESCVVDGHYFSRNDIVFDRQCLYCNPDSTSYNWTLSEVKIIKENSSYILSLLKTDDQIELILYRMIDIILFKQYLFIDLKKNLPFFTSI